MRTIGLGYLLGAYILFRALPVCPLCPAIRINGMSPGNVQTTRNGMKGKEMTSREVKSELEKLALKDPTVKSLFSVLESDNGPWWAFYQMTKNELGLMALDSVIPSIEDEEGIEIAYQALLDSTYQLCDVVNDAYRECYGFSCNCILSMSKKIARALK